MKSLLAALISLLVSLPSVQAVERLLFIGNSYTGVNNLPKIYQDLVASAGRPWR